MLNSSCLRPSYAMKFRGLSSQRATLSPHPCRYSPFHPAPHSIHASLHVPAPYFTDYVLTSDIHVIQYHGSTLFHAVSSTSTSRVQSFCLRRLIHYTTKVAIDLLAGLFLHSFTYVLIRFVYNYSLTRSLVVPLLCLNVFFAYTCACAHSYIHSFGLPSIHPLCRPFILSFIYACPRSHHPFFHYPSPHLTIMPTLGDFTHQSVRVFRTSIRSPIRALPHLSIRPVVRSFGHSFFHPCVHSSTHSSSVSFIPCIGPSTPKAHTHTHTYRRTLQQWTPHTHQHTTRHWYRMAGFFDMT